jgi:hypothetical protein
VKGCGQNSPKASRRFAICDTRPTWYPPGPHARADESGAGADLDPSFGEAGIAWVDAALTDEAAAGLALLPGGEIAVVGSLGDSVSEPGTSPPSPFPVVARLRGVGSVIGRPPPLAPAKGDPGVEVQGVAGTPGGDIVVVGGSVTNGPEVRRLKA